MLWYKAWYETRWRFIVGLILLTALSAGLVLFYPMMLRLLGLPEVNAVMKGAAFSDSFQQALAMMSAFTGYIWSQWFGKNLLQIWAVFAILIGSGGLTTESTRGSLLFTLALPVSRRKLVTARTAMGFVQLSVLVFLPSILIPVMAPVIGERFSVKTTLVCSLIFTLSGTVFFSFSCLLSTFFSDLVKPIVIGLCVLFMSVIVTSLPLKINDYSVFKVMSGQSYYLKGEIPWIGLLICIGLSIAMFFFAFRNIEHRDF